MSFQSYLGLGYSYHQNDQQHQHQEQQKEQEQHQSGDSSNSNSNSIDALMSSYMSACVDYHQQQMKMESSEASTSKSTWQVESHVNSPLHFLPSSSPSSEYHTCTSQHQHQHDISNSTADTTNTATSACHGIPDNQEHNSQTNANENTNTVDQDKLQQAINKAKAIAHRFNSSVNHTTNTTAAAGDITRTNAAIQVQYPYAQKRHEFLTLHIQKLNQYYIHNLDYIAKRDEETLQKQMHHLHSIQERHQQTVTLQQQQQQLKQQQHSQQNTQLRPCLAGIGSRQRKGYQNKKRDLSLSSSLPSCGVYITGLPTSGSNRRSTSKDDMGSCTIETQSQSQELESMLYQLFGSYGKVTSVKLYRVNARNTTTGTTNTFTATGAINGTSAAALKSSHLNNNLPLKGDALIRYDWGLVRKERIGKGRSDDVGEFLEMVCQQVSF